MTLEAALTLIGALLYALAVVAVCVSSAALVLGIWRAIITDETP